MEPMSIIIGALVAGAAAASQDVTAEAIKDAYASLKSLIIRKFGSKVDVEAAVTQLERKPNSKSRQGVVEEELANAGAADDQEAVNQAKALLDLLRKEGRLSGSEYSAIVTGSGAAAVGPGSVAAGEAGIAVSGGIKGDVHAGSHHPLTDQETARE